MVLQHPTTVAASHLSPVCVSALCCENKRRIAVLDICGIKLCVVLASQRQVGAIEEKTRNIFLCVHQCVGEFMCVCVRMCLCCATVPHDPPPTSPVFSLVHQVRVR